MYDVLCRAYPGWSLDTVRDMPIADRGEWLDIVAWRIGVNSG